MRLGIIIIPGHFLCGKSFRISEIKNGKAKIAGYVEKKLKSRWFKIGEEITIW